MTMKRNVYPNTMLLQYKCLVVNFILWGIILVQAL